MEKKKPNPISQPKSQLNTYIKYSGLGIQMIASILICAWIGTKIDKAVETNKPIFTLIFMLLGVGSSIYILIKSLNRES